MASDFLPESNGDGIPSAANGTGSAGPGSPSAPTLAMPGSSDGGPSNASSVGIPKHVDDVINSDIGITTLLNRLKQSIASARDFAAFLKKRSSLEEEQAQGLKRLARSQMEAIGKGEVRGGSYREKLMEVMKTQERMADNGMQFALSLHQMHEDLQELSNNVERGRKTWKHDGLDAEKRASDAEAAMQKAKSRYDNLAEDYDRARTGDSKGSRRMGLKGPKSAEQYESDLRRKVDAADSDYKEKVQVARSQRESLIRTERPKAIKALMELCRECDSGLVLQVQKYATFNEKLLLGNGLAVSPLTGDSKDNPNAQRSMRDFILDIDNDRDFSTYVGSNVRKIPPRPSEIVYQQHPTLAPKTQQPSNRNISGALPDQPPPQQDHPEALPQPTLDADTSQPGSTSSRYSAQAQPPGPFVAPSQPEQYSQQGPPPPSHYQTSPPMQSSMALQHPSSYVKQEQQPQYGASPPYPMHSSERQSTYQPPLQPPVSTILLPLQQRTPQHQSPSFAGSPMSAQNANLPPLRPVFGVSLDELFNRDQSAVPMVVIQCILAVDTFGLEVEGIYRLSGTSSHVAQLKQQFNHNPASIDFRNPANFYHDVNSVATLLKQFFKDLPDPLFTTVGYSAFIAAAKIDDEERRRDALHQGINDLPDANYATLRALVLHLHRVMAHESRNRMGSSNIAMCFAPSLMGTHTGAQIADASLQARVLDTILVNATAIFDED